MGIYLNPGKDEFEKAVNTSPYVDKTGMLAFINSKINTEHQYICVSRPRRFGKSMAANMLVAYYCCKYDSRDLFADFTIAADASFEKHLNKYHVIYLNMQQFLSRSSDMKDMLELLSKKVTRELRREFDSVEYFEDDLVSVLEEIYSQTGNKFVIVIDEWDCVFRTQNGSDDSYRSYLDFLRDMLKNQPFVVLAYMTGILPIKKYGEHSALNMFDEYSMTNQLELAEYTGFTEDEVATLCQQYQMPLQQMKQWYDGYNLKGLQIYNPRSVVMSLRGHDFDSYWTKTETYEALKKYIQMDMYNLRELVVRLIAGESVPVNPDKFQNDMTNLQSADDVLTLLIHLGYLTYDFYKHEVRIPNQEVQKEFINCIEDGGWEPVMSAITSSEELLEATLACDEEKVAEMIEQAHQDNISILKYNDENALACVVSLAYYSARKDYNIYRELAGGKGYADMVFVPRRPADKPAIIVELKWNNTAEAAIAQIKSRQYLDGLQGYQGQVLLVGVSYNPDNTAADYKKHRCRIEEITL